MGMGVAMSGRTTNGKPTLAETRNCQTKSGVTLEHDGLSHEVLEAER
jgi:hypothetical protein